LKVLSDADRPTIRGLQDPAKTVSAFLTVIGASIGTSPSTIE
jgi:hypothetical protein